MPLVSKHFTQPRRNSRLEQCLVSDSAHITRGDRGDYVLLIQLALNQLTDAGLDADSTYGSGTAAAVLAFKRQRNIINPARQTAPDDIVGKMTIDALDREMAARENQLPPQAPVNLKVTPLFGHLLAGCDMNGFSSKRLSRAGPNAIWDRTNLETPIHQMIPVGFNRSLHIEYAGSGTLTVALSKPGIALIVALDRETSTASAQRYRITLQALHPGTTDLVLYVDGRWQAIVRIPVRERKVYHLNAVYLGPYSTTDDVQGFPTKVFSWLNMMITPQTNIVFEPITVRVEPKVSYNGGPPFAIDQSKDLYILDHGEVAPPGAQAVNWSDLDRFCGTTGVTLFYGRKLRVLADKVIGKTFEIGGRKCYTSINDKAELPIRGLIIKAAHEILHSLGAQHIMADSHAHYILCPYPGINSYIFPSETLVDV